MGIYAEQSKRAIELEEKGWEKFRSIFSFEDYALECLEPEEQEEYKKLVKELSR